jgi:hypothetical protein
LRRSSTVAGLTRLQDKIFLMAPQEMLGGGRVRGENDILGVGQIHAAVRIARANPSDRPWRLNNDQP